MLVSDYLQGMRLRKGRGKKRRGEQPAGGSLGSHERADVRESRGGERGESRECLGSSLLVQRLRDSKLPIQGPGVQYLAGEL